MSIKKLYKALSFVTIIAISPLFVFADLITDTAITAEVKTKLIAEKDIPGLNLTVETKDGIVILKGELDTNLQVHKVIEIASSVDKVADVITDNLKVKESGSLLDDSIITAKVKGKIRHLYIYNKIATDYDLHVETTDGVVHIHGNVNKASDIEVIKAAVKGIKGVKSVNVNIKS